MGSYEYPCMDEALTQSEQLGVAMAARLLGGRGAVDNSPVPSEASINSAARTADRLAGEEQLEPFASAATYLRVSGIGATACARRWASMECPINCVLFHELRESDDQ